MSNEPLARSIDDRRLRFGTSGWALIGGQCSACAYRCHPDRPACPRCGSPTHPVDLDPGGEVQVSTVVHVARPGLLIGPPFQALIVALDDGPVTVVPAASEPALGPGARVKLQPVLSEIDGESVTALQAIPESTVRG